MNKLIIVLQDAPYGSEKAYNAFRYASALLANQITVNVFLLADDEVRIIETNWETLKESRKPGLLQ
jgi:sulfur relay (sulfurtransferase) complex TusBCD TusD component (DsrE family)